MMPTEPPPEGLPLPPAAEAPRAAARPGDGFSPEPPRAPVYRWYHKVAAVLLITLCLDVGLTLLIFPWTDYWDNFAAFVRTLRPYLDNMYVRGAISGLGVVNLYISLGEVFRLRRFGGQ